MQQIISVWTSLSPARRLIVALSTVTVFAAVLGLSRLAMSPGMALLYSGLESGAAGDVVEALEQRGVAYEVRGDSIYVDASRRDETRMTLASSGLPDVGAAGYELLDDLSGFGTTSQMFDAAYWRAKEGELARTILASPGIRAARVHIARDGDAPFRRETAPTASVTVTTASGALSQSRAEALRHLVAAAVSGLEPGAVSIIDSRAGLAIPSGGPDAPGAAAGSRAAEIRRRVERLLEAHVGAGRAVVEVSTETVTESETVRERRIDPESRVAISTETEEQSHNATNTANGAVTVASNLPDGDAATGDDAGNGGSRDNRTQTRERVNYEVSEIEREVVRRPGAISRLTVAVLLDGKRVTGPDGEQTWQPRPDDELEALRELVASAVGFDESRGDVITLRSLPFEPPRELGTEAREGFMERFGLDLMSLIQLAALVVVVLALALFVLRPLIASAGGARGRLAAPESEPGSGELLGAGDASPPDEAADTALSGELDFGGFNDNLPMLAPETAGLAPSAEEAADDPVTRLRRLIEERQDETVEILRGWMEDEREERG
ncbi:flagellar M-ring protein FliF [Rhodobacteraceae bacterium WD3A24]|nr:flagellar M-ring protein FliF [Rhodobacteraceae bacterium WD3A24]